MNRGAAWLLQTKTIFYQAPPSVYITTNSTIIQLKLVVKPDSVELVLVGLHFFLRGQLLYEGSMQDWSRNRVGSRVWARWTNMLYYPGTVTSGGYRISVQFDDGDRVDHDPSDFRAVIADNIPNSRAVTVGTRVIADFKNRRRLYYPGTVRAVQGVDARYKVHFDDGDKDSVDLERVRPIPTGRGPSTTVGSRVWARWTNMLYYPGTVTAVGHRIYVQFDDGDRVDHDPSDFRAIIADNIPDYTEVFNGTRVIADFKRRGRLYYPGIVTEGNVIAPRYEIQFDDGDKDTVSLERIRLIP